ncbi:hypothetical protein, partial [Clavibacter lycopersici]|uniref:hypothetical protein n=1 Tax=Clavibacter lycopersici TaxID=2301718 RepID=UPI001314FD3E
RRHPRAAHDRAAGLRRPVPPRRVRRFLRSRQGKAAMAKGKAQLAKRSQKRAAQRTATTRRR